MHPSANHNCVSFLLGSIWGFRARMISWVFLITLLFYALSAGAAGEGVSRLPESDLCWKNVRVGGKTTTVFTLFRDSRGMMWFGTNSGLFFYDGINTHPVGENELFGSQIYSLVEKDNRLFIGSNNGLLVMDYRTGKIAPYPLPTPSEIRMLLLNGEELWIGGLNGIMRLDLLSDTHADNQPNASNKAAKKERLTDCSAGLPHRSVYSILRDSRGIIYAGTYNGLARWDVRSASFKPVKLHGLEKQPSTFFINCMSESDDSESIYLGGEGALYKYSPADNRLQAIDAVEGNNVKSLAQGEAGQLLAGTDRGVYELFKDSIKHHIHDSRHEQSLADNEIWCVYMDDDHNLWTGHERGVSIAANSNILRTIKLGSLVHSGEGNEIHSIYRDSKGSLWFGGTNGIIHLDATQPVKWHRHSLLANTLSHNRIRKIVEDQEGTMWLATDAGLNRYNPAQENFDSFLILDSQGGHPSNWVYALAEERDHLWVGSFLNGIHYVSKDKLRGTPGIIRADRSINADTTGMDGFRLANNLVNEIVIDKDSNLWILLFRDSNLVKYTPATGEYQKFDIHLLTGGYPTHLEADKEGRIWCAYKGGAVVIDGDGQLKTITFPTTNSDEAVLAMGAVGDGMWISTQSNVWKVSAKAQNATLLPVPQRSYVSVYEDTLTNKIYLGTIDEIIEVDPTLMDEEEDFNGIKMILNTQPGANHDFSDLRGAERGLTIPYGGSIALVVSTLNYSPDALQRYMYKLASSPTDTVAPWVVLPEGANTITLSDLKMGHYSVLIKTVGSPSAPVAIPLTVRPPFFLSWWAITCYVLIIIAIIGAIIYQSRKRNRRLLEEQTRQNALDNVEKKLTFLSDISHDLKTPLSMILGPVSLMKEKAKDPESRKSLEVVYDNAVRLNNMIHRTLELQHIEDIDESLLILSRVNVVEFCKGIFDIFKDNNPQKRFFFHASEPDIFIEADAVKLESVITNLLSNACKYSEAGATISCGIFRNEANVEIAVSDDGLGISDGDQQLVFQRMFRSPATSKIKEGTGLGLYLIKRYLELMKGSIELYSKEGQGTTFVVTLPISEEIATETPVSHAEDGGRPRVLLVEDNRQISEFIRGILQDKFTFQGAENGSSGLAIASSFLPDIMIVDEMMPIMSGLEMVKRMKQNPRLASIPIIMLTAKSDNRTENESIKTGIDIFMTKPFDPAALTGRINQLLKGRQEIREKVRIQTIAESEAKPIEAESINEKTLARVARIIEENIADPDLNVNLLCEKSGVANKQLYRLIKKYHDMAPLDYIRSVRLQKAAVLLSQHRFTVSEVSYMVGFKTPSYFARCFQNQFGVKPSQYKCDDETLSSLPEP